jgi:RHS repeat-associated protein
MSQLHRTRDHILSARQAPLLSHPWMQAAPSRMTRYVFAFLWLVASVPVSAFNGECRWEGGAGADGGYGYCAAEDCLGSGGLARCSRPEPAADNPWLDPQVRADKWGYLMCEEGPNYTINFRHWCEAAGGTYDVTQNCTGLPPGFMGPYRTNFENPIVPVIDGYVSRRFDSCQVANVSDTGWGATFSSPVCFPGATTYKGGILIGKARRRTYQFSGTTCGPDFTVSIRMHRAAKCPAGYLQRMSFGQQQCYKPAEAVCPLGNPVSPVTGEKMQQEIDYAPSALTGLQLVRHYNSGGYFRVSGLQLSTPDAPDKVTRRDFWRHTYERRLHVVANSVQLLAIAEREDGSLQSFDALGREKENRDGAGDILASEAGGGWRLRRADRSTDVYDAGGRLASMTSAGGQTTTLVYDLNGLLSSAIGPFGHTLSFTYDADGHLTSLVLPGGGTTQYENDDLGRVVRVTYPDETSRQYHYEDTRNRWLLTGITDEQNTSYGRYAYNDQGRVTLSEHAGGVDRFTFSYVGSDQTTTWDPLGTYRALKFKNAGGVIKLTSMSSPGPWCGTTATSTFNAAGNVATSTTFNGTQTSYTYDPARNLEISRTEAIGTLRARTISTQWHSTHRVPTQIDEPGRRTSYTHDAAGNVLTRTILDTATNESRVWTYAYDSYGRVLSADGPRTDVSDTTTYTYHACTQGYECGQLQSVENALGQTRTFSTYNAHGQPLLITDENGVTTTLAYDSRQRLIARTVGNEETSFQYWSTGLLRRATLPDGSYVEYGYDPAHRLTDITDAEGNRIHYTLDGIGNRTAEEVFDPSNSLRTKLTRQFTGLSRILKEIGAAGTTAVTTGFEHDTAGNLTTISAPLLRTTKQYYDEFSRLTRVLDPVNRSAWYTYNALDQLTSIKDPENRTTTYTYNALGDLKQLASPDTGTATNTYDSAGNLKTSTDARGKLATYGYDGLNRVTSVSYVDQTISYTYDTGTNQKGRLTQITDNSGYTRWTYDPRGRVLSRQQMMGSIGKSVGYAYDASGRLQTVTLPSGNAVSYDYANGQVTGLTLNGSTTVMSDVLYQPFGLTAGWTWGNSTLSVREYDADGKITDIDSAGLKTYGYDNAFRITSITDVTNSSLTQSYAYDLLDRLTSATGTSLTQGWTYDANGNRLTQTGTQPSTYTISTTSNRLSSISGSLTRMYSYDSAGNITNDGTAIFTYNDAGRMVSATKSGVTTTYALNALGQRVKKTVSGVSTYFVYDEVGHLTGEYDTTGALIEETIWFEDIPVAVLKPNGSGGVNLFYLHTDHLNTPRRITRPSDNIVVWRWDSDPFGTTVANEDPDGDSTLFAYNLRFPGQYLDQETGLHYNYFRDYDPQTGRYPQSDPIGLEGGLNTYAYANLNPVSFADPSGLVPGPYTGFKKIPSRATPSTGAVGVSVRCGVLPALMGGSSGGVHCEVVATCKKTGETVAFGIGGGGNGIVERLFGGKTPPKYQERAPALPPSDIAQYTASCGSGDDCGCEALECFKKMQTGNTPPPYYATRQNSNSYAHFLLNQCGCSLKGDPSGAVAW